MNKIDVKLDTKSVCSCMTNHSSWPLQLDPLVVNVTLLSLRSFGFLQLRTSTSFTLFFSFTNSTLGVQAKKTQGVEQPLLFALMRSASRTYDARVSPPQCTSIRDVSFYNIFQLSAILCKWMLSHYPYDISIRMYKNNGKLSNKVQISPCSFFLLSTRNCVSPRLTKRVLVLCLHGD